MEQYERVGKKRKNGRTGTAKVNRVWRAEADTGEGGEENNQQV